jgi:hypothetical protein
VTDADGRFADLIRLVDRLEDRAAGYVTLADVAQAGVLETDAAIAANVLLLDYRQRLDGDGNLEPVTLCRLNRHHPLVQRLTGW